MTDNPDSSWRHEFRDHLADVESLEADLERSRRSLIDIVVDEGRHGSTVRLETLAGDFEGTISHVGDELIELTTAGRSVMIGLPSVTAVLVTAPGDEVRRVTRGHPRSLLALGRELAQSGARVEVGRAAGTPIVGHLVAAGDSHLELDTPAGPSFVPVSAIGWLVRNVD